jgi:hypothetical protein
LNIKLSEIAADFLNLITSKCGAKKISKTLQNWSSSSQSEFLIELKKNNIVNSLLEESDWLKHFNEQKSLIENLKIQIEKTENEIDKIVYGLYNLADEEIKIVEENV